MRSVVEHVAGLGVIVLLFVLLSAGLGEPEQGLQGELRGAGPYLVGPGASAVSVGPPSLLPRVKQQRWGSDALQLTTWSVTYGERWHRALTVPELRGPLDEEGTAWCGMAARISPGVLDPKQSGEGLLALVKREMDKVLPISLPCGFTRNVTLPRPKAVSLAMTPRAGAIDLEVVADLPDGTKVGAASTVRLEADANGHLVVDHVGPVKPLFAGPARARCEGTLKVQLGQLWWRYIEGNQGSIVMATARAEMTRQITPALDALNAALATLHAPMRPFPEHDVEMALRLARPPEVGPDGIGLHLCASVKLGGPRVDAAITGPPVARAAAPPLPVARSGASIDVNLNAEAMNRIVYVLWQIGELRRWGTSTAIVDQLPDDVKSLAFDVTGFDPRLPPVVDADRSRVVAANIAVGTWGDRTVMGHATGEVRLRTEGERVLMTAAIDQLGVSCVERDGASWRVTPCLSELLPLIGEQLVARPPHFSIDTSQLVQAIAGHTVHGLQLALSPPVVELQKGMLKAQMSVKVGAARQ